MPKAANVPPLNLASARNASSSPQIGALSARSIDSPRSPTSPPLSPALPGYPPNIDMQMRADSGPGSPRIGAMSDLPSSPSRTSPTLHSRDASKSFFSNLMASKSSHKLQSQPLEPAHTDAPEKVNGRTPTPSKDRSVQSLKKQSSTPDLPRLMTSHAKTDEGSDATLAASAESAIAKQRSKSKLGGILARSRSGRPEEEKKYKQKAPSQLNLEIHPPPDSPHDQHAAALKTAPIKNTFREQMLAPEGGTIRNRSADRAGLDEPRLNGHFGAGPFNTQREGHSLLANIQHHGRGVGDRLGKAGRGLFSKMTRSGSTTERELVPDEQYVCTTINLPLVKQTRKTRIAKKLEMSKDKTEYWMPALPWRCIDYLNMQCEQEGLYRVPGSGRDVKFWQRRFDTEHDINLFEEPELYDVNTIASMFKAWLRDLPDDLFPKAIQAKIAKECQGAQRTPKLLKDELSKLPPFNYYLLFAITCHLSLLHSYADQNKMDYRNLCICFQPCLKIDAFCFQFLVIDWKECWQQGCWTEKEYLAEEMRYEKEGSITEPEIVQGISDERAVSSSDSSTNLPMNGPAPTVPPRSADSNRPLQQQQQQQPPPASQPQSVTQIKPKQRSLSSTGREQTRTPSHGHAQTAPAVPRVITKTPEQGANQEPQRLPELGNMSPIRM